MSTDNEALRALLSASSAGYITLEVPARPVEDLRQPEELARAADEVPRVAPVRQPTGRSVAVIYEEILGAIVPPRGVSPKRLKALAAARQLLFEDDEARTPSHVYRTYLQRKATFDAVRAAGGDTHAVWTALQTAQPGRIEAALAALAQHSQGDLTTAFAEAQAAFVAGRREGGTGIQYYVCNAMPAQFWIIPDTVHYAVGPALRSITRVMLDRPWFRVALLSRAGWSVPGRGSGVYSSGRADESNNGLLPLVPIAFFIEWEERADPRIVAWENLIVPLCPP